MPPFDKLRVSGLLLRLRLKNLLNLRPEQRRNAESEGEGRIIFPRLNRVDRLARDLEAVAQILLAPAAFGAQRLELVFHAQGPSVPVMRFQIAPIPKPMNQKKAAPKPP